MHTVFFALKRAHHGTLRITRSVLTQMGLTAARFDMLYAIKEGPKTGMLQSALRRALGVCRATVSRMLASLEELGLVVRTAYPHDRRQRRVELTTRGRWRIAFAYRHITRSGWVQLAIDSALVDSEFEPRWCDFNACVNACSQLRAMLNRLRHGFFDRAELDYPWDPYLIDSFDPDDEGHLDQDTVDAW